MGKRGLWCSAAADRFPECASPIQLRGLLSNRTRIPCGHLTREHFGENLVDTLERRWGVLVKMREQETNCRRLDNTPGTRKHRATELFNERHGLSALFCSGFLARYRLRRTYLSSQSRLRVKVQLNRISGPLTRHPFCGTFLEFPQRLLIEFPPRHLEVIAFDLDALDDIGKNIFFR